MISSEFVRDTPRIGVADLDPALDGVSTSAAVDLRVDVDGVDFSRRVELRATRMPRRRGARWWLVCPACRRRCTHLYPTRGLVCRRCAGLKYVSQTRRLR
jgi:hypothetical protein